MALDGTLVFDTKIDKSGFENGIGDLQKSASTAGNVMKGVLGANFLQAGLEKLAEGVKKGVGLASDLEEVQNVVDVTFGQGAAQIEAFADSASTSFGLTELQAKQFSGTIGAMVKSMGLTEKEALDMSTSLVGLTGDMASFYNLDHQTAFDKIRSGISGETEPLKQLGINMSVANLEAYRLSKGIKTAYDNMSEAEKVNLRYGYIMQQTTDAQGDFVRTQDSYANQVRMLQNNLDTLAANVGSLLVPALTSAVGWVNNLFAGPETSELQTKINAATTALQALDGDVQGIKNRYAQDSIKIRVDYSEASELIDTLESLKQETDKGFGDRTLKFGMSGADVEALQTHLVALGYAINLTDEVGVFGESTEAALKAYQGAMGLIDDGIAGAKTYAALNAADTERLASVTRELVEIYPELEQYVGENGVLMLEKEQVDDLLKSYRDLRLEKLMTARVDEIGAAYAEGLINMELLKQAAADAKTELEELTEKQAEMQEAYAAVYAIAEARLPSVEPDVDGGLDAINAYIAAFGGLSDEIVELTRRNGGDVGSLFDDTGLLKSAEDIIAMEDGLSSFNALIDAIYSVGGEQQYQLADDVKEAETALETATSAVTQYQSTLDELKKDVETAERALENFRTEAETRGQEAGELAGKTAADGIIDQESEIKTAVRSVGEAGQTEANRHPIKYPVTVETVSTSRQSRAYPGHATGLDYVPHDNYLARLHVGESVLTASEAQQWRESKNSGGGVTAAELISAMEPVVSAISNIRIALDIDGREFASNQAGNARAASAEYGRRIARGFGKR